MNLLFYLGSFGVTTDTIVESPADLPQLVAGELGLSDDFAACFDELDCAIVPALAAGELDSDNFMACFDKLEHTIGPPLAKGELVSDNFAACFDKLEHAIAPPLAAGKLDLATYFFCL
jgi:hypothetical protein